MTIQTTSTLGSAIAALQNNQKNQKQKTAIFLVGAPNAGKGVGAEAIKSLGIKHYSSSGSLRSYARLHRRTDILEKMKTGGLVDIEDVQLVSTWDYNDFLMHQKFGLFDGWWRIPKEPLEILPVLKKARVQSRVFALWAEKECLRERALGRCREDADSVIFENRFRIHEQYFDRVVEIAKKNLGDEHVYPIDTTHLSKDQVQSQIISCLPSILV